MSGRAPSTGRPGLLANAGALLASRIVVAALGWLGTVIMVRTMSIPDFGRFTLVFTVLGVLSIVTDMGIGRTALSGITADGVKDGGGAHLPPGEFTGTYILLRTMLGLVGYGLGLGFVIVAGYDSSVVVATAVGGVVVVLATPSNAYMTVFQAHTRLRGVAIAQVAGRVVQLGLIAFVAAAGGTLIAFTLPAVAAEVVILAWLGWTAHRMARIRYRIRLGTWQVLLKEAAPLSVGAALATVYHRVDTIMLSQMADFTAVAVYGIVYKFVDLLHYASSAVTTAVLPLLVAAWPNRPEAMRAPLRHAAIVLAAVGAASVLGALFFAEPVVVLLYGEEYRRGARAVVLSVTGQAISFVGALALTVLVATGQNRRYPLIALLGLVLNVALNLVLIPRATYEGAALATLLTELAVALALVHAVWRTPGLRPSRSTSR